MFSCSLCAEPWNAAANLFRDALGLLERVVAVDENLRLDDRHEAILQTKRNEQKQLYSSKELCACV